MAAAALAGMPAASPAAAGPLTLRLVPFLGFTRVRKHTHRALISKAHYALKLAKFLDGIDIWVVVDVEND